MNNINNYNDSETNNDNNCNIYYHYVNSYYYTDNRIIDRIKDSDPNDNNDDR